jgi:plasmid rolling circle replication initiator protein Rep
MKRLTRFEDICEATGEILKDKKKSGKVRPWPVYRKDTESIADAFAVAGYSRHSERCAGCGVRLTFAECAVDSKHFRKLIGGNFCRVRLCPMCIARRALKLAVQAHAITHEALKQRPGLRFVFLTLTVPNVIGDDLSKSITDIFKSWKRLIERCEVDRVLVGSFRALEVTYNAQRNDFHPHIHALLGVSPTYFGGSYIKQSRWLELWRESARDQSIVSVDIRAVKPKLEVKEGENPVAGAVAEVCKYPIKSADILHPTVLVRDKDGQVVRGKDGKALRRPLSEPTVEQTAEVVGVLHRALHGRRLAQFGGLLAEIHKELKMDTVDSTDDLVSLGGEHEGSCPVCQAGLLEHVYKWVAGVGEYIG